MSRSDVHDATVSRFLDERGIASLELCPNGLNPANVLEKAVRDRIVNSMFFQDVCFGLNEADIVSRVVSHVNFIGGTYGTAQTPSPFICLAFKLLQLAPDEDIVVHEYIKFGGEKFKYLRALGLFYIRMTRPAKECYEILEPYLEDHRKLRRRGRDGKRLGFMDDFVDELLTKERVCGTSFYKIPRRRDLEDMEVLEPRISKLGDIEDLLDEIEDDEVQNSQDKEENTSQNEEWDSTDERLNGNAESSSDESNSIKRHKQRESEDNKTGDGGL